MLTSSAIPPTRPLIVVTNNNHNGSDDNTNNNHNHNDGDGDDDNNKHSNTEVTKMPSPLMTAQSQSSTTNMMMSYTSAPQFAGTKRPAPFSQSKQQRQHQHQHQYRQHPPPPFGVNNCNNGITQHFVDGGTTTEQPSAATSIITSPTDNFGNNTNNIITAVSSSAKNPYNDTSNPSAIPSVNANNTNTGTTITPNVTTSTTPTTAEILTPLNREGKNLSEKKIRRLEKNRLSARNCRRKKKEVTQTLQKEINILEGENLRLRLQLKIGAEAEQSSRQEQDRVTEILDALLKSGASDSEIYANIEEFKEKFADYGRDCRSAIDFHLRNVKRLLMPTTTTNVALRALRWGVVVSGGAEGGITSGNIKLKEDDNSGGGSSEALANNEAVASMAQTMSNLKENMKFDVVNSKTTSPHPSSIDTRVIEAGPDTTQQQQLHGDGNGKVSIVKRENDIDPVHCVIVGTPFSDQRPSPTVSTTHAKTATVSTPAFKDTAALEPKALFQYLVNYLEVTPAQATALKDSRHVSQELDAALVTSLKMLEELRERLTRCGEDLDEEFSTIRSILTPRQAAKFLVWVANNEACMHMLNELWSKVYPEPIVMPSSTAQHGGTGGDIAEITTESLSDNFYGKDSKKE